VEARANVTEARGKLCTGLSLRLQCRGPHSVFCLRHPLARAPSITQALPPDHPIRSAHTTVGPDPDPAPIIDASAPAKLPLRACLLLGPDPRRPWSADAQARPARLHGGAGATSPTPVTARVRETRHGGTGPKP
jgi:hypothetical protein